MVWYFIKHRNSFYLLHFICNSALSQLLFNFAAEFVIMLVFWNVNTQGTYCTVLFLNLEVPVLSGKLFIFIGMN